MQFGLAEVKSHKQRLLSIHGENRGQVGGDKGLTGPHHVGGDQDGLLLFTLQHIVDVGTHRPERLRDGRFGVLHHHHLAGLLAVDHMADNGQGGDLLHILAGQHLVVEIIFSEDIYHRNNQPKYQGDHIVKALFGEDRIIVFPCSLVNNLVVGEVGRQGDLGFGTFLQQEGVDGISQFELALNAKQDALGFRQFVYLSVDEIDALVELIQGHVVDVDGTQHIFI